MSFQIQQAVSDRLRSSKEHKDEEDYQPDDDIIPGYGFVMLLHEIPEQTYQGMTVEIDQVIRTKRVLEMEIFQTFIKTKLDFRYIKLFHCA